MTYKDIAEIKSAGFIGFKKISELSTNPSEITDNQGIYMVLFLDKSEPQFLSVGTGGHFKKKNPNVSMSELRDNWVKDSIVVYIGKAGGSNSKATLRSRLKQYLSFGQGNNIGHWGGRLIWQLKNSKDLVICWKSLTKEEPRVVESEMIQDFVRQFKVRPFANLSD